MKRENVALLLKTVFELQEGFHVLIIDDGSPDGTADIVKNLFVTYPGKLFLRKE